MTVEDPKFHADEDKPADSDEGSPGTGSPDTVNDEQSSREHIAETGEPDRDALGNQDGAS